MSAQITEEGIDETIERALNQWRGQPMVTDVRLVSAVPFFMPDLLGPAACFVTVIMDVEIEKAREKIYNNPLYMKIGYEETTDGV
jgi:hypothetical protein